MSTYGNLNVSTINGGAIGAKNAIINGNFGINQRGVSGTVTLAAGVYGHDRWKAGASGCTYTFATSENVTTLTISAGSLIQVIEGINLQTGTYTLSWEGTAQGKIGAGSYGNSGVSGSVTGGTNLNIEFGTGTVRLAQLEKGSVATPFEFRSIGQELALCQRYYQRQQATTSFAAFGFGNATSGSVAQVYVKYSTPMRANPTSTYGNLELGDGATAGIAVSSISAGYFTPDAASLNFSVSSGLTQYRAYMLQSRNTANGYLDFSAEL